MEVPFESFSIRAYTARMRRVDASKCWPFDGDGRGRQLPPIECRRYRWWSSELQIARSADACAERPAGASEHACGELSCVNATPGPGEAGGGGPPAPRAADGVPVVQQEALVLPAQPPFAKEDEDGEEEGRPARSPGKAKVKTPKKRSIVELFAVAPQIEALEDGAEGGEDGKAAAVGKASDEEPKDDQELDKDAVEEPRKRKEESVERLMRKKKKIKKNSEKKDKEIQEKAKKKTKMQMLMRKQQKQKQKLLKQQKKQKTTIKIGIAKKEKICKLSLPSSADFARLLRDSVIMKRFGKEIKVPVYAQRKKPVKSKGAPKQNKVKVQTSKLKKQLSEANFFPIHSILKNQKTVSSPGQVKFHTTDGSQNGDEHHAQQSEKHVRFSGKDDILGHGERHYSPLGSTHMQSLCKVFSDVLAASSVVDKSPDGGKLSESINGAQVGTEKQDVVSDCAVSGKTGEPLLSKQLTDVHDLSHAATSANPQSNHAKDKIALDDCVDLNKSLQVNSNLNMIDTCPTEPVLKVGSSSQPEGCDPLDMDDTGKKTNTTDAVRSLPSGSAAVISLTNIVRDSNTESATSSLSPDMVACQSQFYPVVEHHKDMHTYDSEYQSSCFLKRDMMSAIYSTGSVKQLYHMDDFPGSRLNANPVDMFSDKHTSGSIIGLPLNSQGEYIHLQSSSQFGFDQLLKKQNMVLGPVGSLLAHNSIDPSSMDHINVKGKVPQSSVYAENQQKWVPEKSCTRNLSISMPISGFTDLKDISQSASRNKEFVRKCDQFVSNLNVEANLLRVPYHDFREQSQSHSHNDRAMAEQEGALEPGFQSIAQPTMRLMGKNFIVGRCDNNKDHQCSGESKIWADKKMTADLGPALRMSEETSPKQWPRTEWGTHPTSGTSYENLMQTLEMQRKHSASNFFHLRVDPRSDNAHLDHGQCMMSANGRHSVSFSHGYKLDPFNHPHAHEAWLSKASMTKSNCGSGSESLKMGFHAPLAVCNPENVCQHLILNSTHCKHSQTLSHSMTSTFPPSSAFQNPDNGKYFQHPLAQCSSQSLPHWLLNAGPHRKTSNSSALSFSESVPRHEPRTKSGTNIFPLPSPPLTSIMSFPSLGQNSHVCFSDLPTSASLVHSSLIPSFPAAKSSSASSTCYWNMCNSRDDMKSKFSFPESSNFANKTRKRPAQVSNSFLKPMKKPNLCTQGSSRAPMGSKTGEQLQACSEHISKILEHRSYGEKTVTVSDVVKDARASAHSPSTSKLDSGSRSRPVKLSAGAKHVLKPSLNMDQDNSMPTHSTIPFAHGTSSGKVPVSQKKPAKVYQF